MIPFHLSLNSMKTSTQEFLKARNFLLQHRDDYETAYRDFQWPKLEAFNWALDWFDIYAQGNQQTALHLISDASEKKISYAEMSETSARVAQAFLKLGLKRGDRLLIMLGNYAALWEAVLAAQKIGAVVVPTATQASTDDLQDRFQRGQVKMILTDATQAAKFDSIPEAQSLIKILAEDRRPGWLSFDDLKAEERGVIPGQTKATDPFLLYFTSGTTAKPKLVLHTHQSYPVGHLSTMYWIGIREKSVHQNISSPGWAKHAWSSFFAPLNAGATVLAHEYARFQPEMTLDILRTKGVNSLCAPPTVWRMLIQSQLKEKPATLTELVSAGEPLNPEIIDQVQDAWGITIRDGFGQTETSAQIANSPGCKVKLGSMGRPLPGFRVALLDADGKVANEGEVALRLEGLRPLGLMQEYFDDVQKTQAAMSNNFYRTGDEAAVDKDGYYHFVGRGDDVFKSSDYRISPFELESVLLENELVAESAVIPSPDPLRLSVPKAVIVLKAGVEPNAETAKALYAFIKQKLAPYKQVRRLEFGDLPKTISGKIRRVQLRKEEEQKYAKGLRGPQEFWIEDFK